MESAVDLSALKQRLTVLAENGRRIAAEIIAKHGATPAAVELLKQDPAIAKASQAFMEEAVASLMGLSLRVTPEPGMPPLGGKVISISFIQGEGERGSVADLVLLVEDPDSGPQEYRFPVDCLDSCGLTFLRPVDKRLH